MHTTIQAKGRLLALTLCALVAMLGSSGVVRAEESEWRIGLASAQITPEEPIPMAGYASRNKPSEGVLADLYAKAMAFEDAEGGRAVLLTADVISYNGPVADSICRRITEKTGLERRQILLNPSHTHTGPVIGIPRATGYSLEGGDLQRVHEYAEKLTGQLVELAAAALAEMKPSRLSWGVGVTNLVMNRREFTEHGVQLGFNARGHVDRSVPVLRVD